MDRFTASYVRTALWSSTEGDSDIPLDHNYSKSDLSPETLAKIEADCARFQEENADDLSERADESGGHDFWLTRNGHGAGFWDGDWSDAAGKRLTAASKRFGEVSLYVGDDGQIYQG